MNCGQLLCLYTDIIISKWYPNPPEYDANGKQKIQCPAHVYAIPALCDTIGSSCYAFGLVLCALSITQIMGSLLIVGSALISSFYLHRKLHSHHILSLVLIFCGIVLSGVAILLFDKEKGDRDETSIVGILLLLFGYIVWSIQSVAEEKIFTVYQSSPLRAIGFEGLNGLIFNSTLTLIFSFVSCSPIYSGKSKTSGMCIYNVIENPGMALIQIYKNKALLWECIGYVLITSFVNVSIIAVVKYGSAIHTCIIFNMRTVTLWAISILFKWEYFIWLELVAFLGLVLLGALIYNEILVIPWFGLNKNLEKANKLK
jgi:drug/metabolite transporter (DMT)-like permease